MTTNPDKLVPEARRRPAEQVRAAANVGAICGRLVLPLEKASTDHRASKVTAREVALLAARAYPPTGRRADGKRRPYRRCHRLRPARYRGRTTLA